MIRYVHTGNQTMPDDDGYDGFALYDTVTNQFVDLAGDQVFNGVAELREAWACEDGPKPEWERLVRLIPGDQHGQ